MRKGRVGERERDTKYAGNQQLNDIDTIYMQGRGQRGGVWCKVEERIWMFFSHPFCL